MAALRPGTVSGYQSHGPERRADAGSPRPHQIGGTPAIGGNHPSLQAKPLLSPARPGAVAAGMRAARVLQAAQFPKNQAPPAGGGGWTWTASTVPPPPPGQAPGGGNVLPPGPGMPYNQGWVPSASQPGSGWGTVASYGGAAWNGGGGGLANAIGGGPKMITGRVEPPDEA